MRQEQNAPPGANADRTESRNRELQPQPLAGLAAALADVAAHVRDLARLAEEFATEFARLSREKEEAR